MSLNHVLHTRSRILYTCGVAGAACLLLTIGCAAAPAAPIPHDAGSPAAAPAPAHDAHNTRCVTIERGINGDVKDSRIAVSSPDRNYGDLLTTTAGSVGGKERLALFKFELAGIPAGASVVRATFSLHRASVTEAPFTVHRAEAAWDEKDVTWNTFEEAYDRVAETTMWTHADGSNVATVDITTLVREWVDGTAANNGLVLRPGAHDGPLSLGAFFTSEADSAANRPRLEVCFAATDPAATL